jgi:aminoglycoside phosphotransferase (APT) family kinase protein
MARTLAALHSVQPAAVGLADFGKAGGYNRRQVWRWGRQYQQSVPQVRSWCVTFRGGEGSGGGGDGSHHKLEGM